MTDMQNSWRFAGNRDDEDQVLDASAPGEASPPSVTSSAAPSTPGAPPPAPARSRATTLLMIALGVMAVGSLAAMRLFTTVQENIAEGELAAVRGDFDEQRAEAAAGWAEARADGAAGGADASRLPRVAGLLARGDGDRDGQDADAIASRCLSGLLEEMAPALEGYDAMFEEIVLSDDYHLAGIRSPETCQAAIVAFMRFRSAAERLHEACSQLPSQLEQALVDRSIPASRARVIAQEVSDELAGDLIVQRLDIDIADAVVELFTMLQQSWGAWALAGDEVPVSFDDPAEQVRFDRLLARITQLEQRQDEALHTLAAE